MPWPVPYNGGQDDDRTRSIDNVHIEPSIREGTFLVTSLYGPDASRPLDRFPPVNTSLPFLNGSGVIPNTVICEIGTWVASPTPDFYFQWMLNGVDIPGATNQSVTTDASFDGGILSCEVRADNGIGEDYAVSNTLACSLIEPIETHSADFLAITGLNSPDIQTTFDDRTMFVSGLGTDNRQDVMRAVSYYLTGIGADNRKDVNAMPIVAVTGLQQTDHLSVLERDIGINVIWYDEGRALVDGVPQALKLINGNAELGTFGWDVFGEATTWDQGSEILTPIEGERAFHGGFNVHPEGNNTPYTSLSQDIYLWDIWHADIDASTCFLFYSWLQGSYTDITVMDQANIKVEFYAADMTTLTGTYNGPGMFNSPRNVWFPREATTPIPPLTRYVRIIQEFLWDVTSDDNDLDAYIDQIQPFIRKGAKVTGLNYGPNMQYWRVRFTTALAWSGSALSELEFLDAPGGVDTANGGAILFGSAGFGVSNADAAFDGILSNYWAGGENAVTEGTSWVGYDFLSPTRPGAVQIVARPGSNALQTGRSFMVEASEDGINWVPFEEYDLDRVARPWNSGEAREFEIQSGTMPFMYDGSGGFPAPTLGYSIQGGDDYDTKGIVYKNMARSTITHLRFGLMNQAHDFDWQVTRIIDLNSPAFYFGRVSEIHEEGSYSFLGVGAPSDATEWVEIALTDPFHLEPGEYFLINYWDKNLSTNPNTVADGGNDPNQGRLNYVTNHNGFLVPDRRRWLRLIDGWQEQRGIEGLYNQGEVCGGPFQTGTGYNWAIDFRGNFY